MTRTDAVDGGDAYGELLERWGRVVQLDDVGNVLFWDQQVTMPAGGTPARSAQRGTLSSLRHGLVAGERTGDLLDAAREGELDGDRRAVLREIGREHERVASVDDSLLDELSRATSDANEAWQDARADDDFETFAPHLERIIGLKREYAAQVDPDAEPFAVLVADWEPYLGVDVAAETLDRLREELVPLVDAIRESDVDPAAGVFEGTYDAGAQRALSEAALDFVGLDWSRARLDEATHPFSYGNRYDVRLTTRFDEADPVDGLTSTLHEFGHTAYTHGLPEEHVGSPLGAPRSHAVHESQSRFFENHVGRTQAFWEVFLPTFREHFPEVDVDAEAAYGAANAVAEENHVRVEADELTYHLHILLRFEVERALVNGDIDVADVPAVWNEKAEAYLGHRPPSDSLGCLQDIHWSFGQIGSFQNYTLGTVLAAQLAAAFEGDVGSLDDHVRAGDIGTIREWLTERVHRQGQRYTTPELIERATGDPLSADAFLDYATAKYTALYDL